MSSQPQQTSLMPAMDVGFDLPATPIESSTQALLPQDVSPKEDRKTYRRTLSMLEILIIASAISVGLVMICLLLTAVRAR
jgi:hypothetical protein